MDLQHDPWEEDEDQENVDLDSAEDLDDEDDEDSEPEEIVISKEDWDLEIEKDEESYLWFLIFAQNLIKCLMYYTLKNTQISMLQNLYRLHQFFVL